MTACSQPSVTLPISCPHWMPAVSPILCSVVYIPLGASFCSRAGCSIGAEQRKSIYALFLQYEKKKGVERHWDVGDLTAHIHRQLKAMAGGFPAAARFDYVYVDEVGG